MPTTPTATRLAASAALILGLAAPALAQDVQYELINDSGLTLMEFYTSPASAGAWGDDMLGADVIPAGETGTVALAGGPCDVDLRLVFEDGQERVDSVNVCDAPSYVIAAN